MYHDFCGIDFGTTNSAVSVLSAKNNSELIKFDNNSTIPTAIYFPEDGVYNPQFGKKAIKSIFDDTPKEKPYVSKLVNYYNEKTYIKSINKKIDDKRIQIKKDDLVV